MRGLGARLTDLSGCGRRLLNISIFAWTEKFAAARHGIRLHFRVLLTLGEYAHLVSILVGPAKHALCLACTCASLHFEIAAGPEELSVPTGEVRIICGINSAQFRLDRKPSGGY